MNIADNNFVRNRRAAAADWWTRLRDPHAAADTTEQWLAWTDADPHNLQAFEQVNSYAQNLPAFDAAARARLLREFAQPAAAAWRRGLPLAAAAAVLLSFAAGYLALRRPAASAPLIYSTAIAQNRNFVLPDDSHVALGAASSLRIAFSDSERRVELIAGEAFFEVNHDAQRPFVVAAAGIMVHDIGTAFDVRRTGQRVNIAVTRGRVRISAGVGAGGNTANGQAVDAVAGQLVDWDPQSATLRVGGVTAEQATGWRERRLEFIHEPLGVVIANVNRYRTQPVRVEDDNLAALSFTGTVHADATDNWLRALPQVFPLRVVRQDDRTVILPR